MEADKRALSLKGKTKVYEQAKKRLEKAKAALTKATDGADSDGMKFQLIFGCPELLHQARILCTTKRWYLHLAS